MYCPMIQVENQTENDKESRSLEGGIEIQIAPCTDCRARRKFRDSDRGFKSRVSLMHLGFFGWLNHVRLYSSHHTLYPLSSSIEGQKRPIEPWVGLLQGI